MAEPRLLAKVRGRTAKQAREIIGVRQDKYLGQHFHVEYSVGIKDKRNVPRCLEYLMDVEVILGGGYVQRLMLQLSIGPQLLGT
jgi:hypothetical protein